MRLDGGSVVAAPPKVASIQAVISSRIALKTASRSSSVPVAAEGSGKLAWIVRFAPGNIGQVAAAASQTVTTTSISSPMNSPRSLDRWPEISTPISAITRTVRGLTVEATVPALKASYRSPYRARR